MRHHVIIRPRHIDGKALVRYGNEIMDDHGSALECMDTALDMLGSALTVH